MSRNADLMQHFRDTDFARMFNFKSEHSTGRSLLLLNESFATTSFTEGLYIAKDITRRFKLDPRKTASILDTFSCLIQGFIPYGAQLLMAAGLAEVSSISIIGYLYYPLVMGIFAIGAIIFRLPRKM